MMIVTAVHTAITIDTNEQPAYKCNYTTTPAHIILTRNTLDCDQSNVYSSRVIFFKYVFSLFLFRPISPPLTK